MPNALGFAAEIFNRVEHRFAGLNFNCLYVECVTEWSVLFVNWSTVTVTRLQNSYKQKNLFAYASMQNLRTIQPVLRRVSGSLSVEAKKKKNHSLKFLSIFHEKQSLISLFCILYV